MRERDEHVRAVADPRDADAVERAEALADRHRVGERLARVLELGQRVDHRDRRGLGPRLELVVRERADRERVDVAREHLRRVLERLAARELHLARQQRDRRAAELRHRDRERDPRARRRLAEVEAERAAGEERRAGSPSARRRRRGSRRSRRARGRRSAAGRGRRAPTALTTSAPSRPRPRRATSPSRGAAGGASNVPSRTLAATCSCASRNGTPSRTSASAASVARSSGSAHAAASRSRSNASPRTSTASAPSAPGDVAPRGEHRRLVLLQVAVVGERQALHRREQPGEPPDRRAGLAARELGDVGVQLLRHHRRPGRGVLGQAREAELARRPEHELLADPREVREEHRARRRGSRARSRDPRRRRSSCASRSAAAAAAASSPRARRRRAATARACARGEREARAVALEHLDPREQVVAERDRDRALEVRVARHRRVGLLLGAVEDRGRERAQRLVGLGARVGDVEPERGRDLVVARAAGVDLAADVAEQPLDRRVDVLVGLLEVVDRDRREPRLGVAQLRRRSAARPRAAAPRARACPRGRTAAAPRRPRAGTPTPRARAPCRRVRPRASRARAPADRSAGAAGRSAAAGAPRASAASRRCRSPAPRAGRSGPPR